MTKTTKIIITIAVTFGCVVLLPALLLLGLQAGNNLLWQLSYLLPSSLVGPLTIMLVALLVVVLVAPPVLCLVWVWRKASK